MSLVGHQLGRYRILEQLGSGGMSIVYKGLDTALEREVAVKVLHPHLAGRLESRQRLAREARAVARLHHPNIVEVFDFSEASAREAFLVTEYIRGRTLEEFLSQGEALEPPELAALVVHEVASALAHAHEAGVIHRDLKPENVMVREDGVLKLMDFGIAKVLDTEERMTATGTLVGSPAHMAPEIIEGQEAGPEADVFSLGTMLYLFITGRLPFSAPNTTATLKRILDGHYEDPRRRAPALSDELAAICATCLEHDRQRRYSSASRLRDALADYLASVGLERPGEELVSFFADPPSYRRLLRQRLITALLERSERLLAERRTPRALASLNQVLALDGQNARALALLQGVERARRRQRLRTLALRAGAGLALAGALGLAGLYLWSRPGTAPSAPRPSNGAQATLQAAASVGPLPRAQDSEPALRAPSPRPASSADQRLPPERPSLERTTEPIRPAVNLERVAILVRPFGFIRVDGGPRSSQALAQHNLSLAPGPHTVTITCQWCEDTQETIEVQPGQQNVFHLRAQLKTTLLSFDYEPKEALVRVGEQQRSARETLATPFEIRSPRGPPSFQHQVEYEISYLGYRTERRVVQLEPGKALTLHGALTAE